MSNQIQLRERASYSYCARSWRQLRLEQLLRIFRALQTSRVLHISMNTQLTYEPIVKYDIINLIFGTVDIEWKMYDLYYQAEGKAYNSVRSIRKLFKSNTLPVSRKGMRFSEK